MEQNSIQFTHKHIAKEWHIKNDILPTEVGHGSRRKVWWQCPLNIEHEWQAIICDRTLKKSGCPYCKNKKVCPTNCLATINPIIAQQWHPSKNGLLTPNNVSPGSDKKIWWQCPLNTEHVWRASVARRKQYGCPYCCNQKTCLSNCLITTHPNIIKEWHPTKNGTLTPNDFTFGSKQKIWWQCPNNLKHIYKTSIHLRTTSSIGCTICNKSKGEVIIANYLLNNNICFERQYTFPTCRNINMLLFDFCIKNTQIKLIEFQGRQHYEMVNFSKCKEDSIKNFQRTQENDIIKKNWCKENKIPLLEIPYWEMGNIETILEKFI